MREILFRGKTFRGEWITGLLAYDKSKNPDYPWYISKNAVPPFAYNVIPETVGEYTGLLEWHRHTKSWEREPQKVFEGDIVKVDLDWPPGGEGCRDGIIGVVVFVDGMFCFTSKPKSEDRMDRRELYDCYNIEVIGNITDTPELLKENV